MTDEATYEAMIEAMARAMEPLAWTALGLADTSRGQALRDRTLVHARAAAEAIGLKPGCVVVPREPTPGMSAAGQEMIEENVSYIYGGYEIDAAAASEAWRAMIAASLPRQPEKEWT